MPGGADAPGSCLLDQLSIATANNNTYLRVKSAELLLKADTHWGGFASFF